jgi:hypothetical protein
MKDWAIEFSLVIDLALLLFQLELVKIKANALTHHCNLE